jgi:hypothetical protein
MDCDHTSVSIADTPAVINAIRARMQERPNLDAAFERVIDPARPERAHLTVMHQPYLSYVLAGRKTVESRFSRHRIAPFDQVGMGDLLVLKSQSGPVTGVALIAHVDSYVLDPTAWAAIKDRFGEALCIDDDRFWAERRDARYATLMRLASVVPVEPLLLEKTDRRPWVVLVPPTSTLVHRDQLSLVPEEACPRQRSPARLAVRYELTAPERRGQLLLLE